MAKEDSGRETIRIFDNPSNLELFIKNHREAFASLTPRERKILQLVAGGESTVEISILLKQPPEAVANVRMNIGRKLSIRSRAGYAKFALAFGLIPF